MSVDMSDASMSTSASSNMGITIHTEDMVDPPCTPNVIKVTNHARSSSAPSRRRSHDEVILYIYCDAADPQLYLDVCKEAHKEFARAASETSERDELRQRFIGTIHEFGGRLVAYCSKEWVEVPMEEAKQQVWLFLQQKCFVSLDSDTDVLLVGTSVSDSNGRTRFLEICDTMGDIYAAETDEDSMRDMATSVVSMLYDEYNGQFVRQYKRSVSDDKLYYIVDDEDATRQARCALDKFRPATNSLNDKSEQSKGDDESYTSEQLDTPMPLVERSVDALQQMVEVMSVSLENTSKSSAESSEESSVPPEDIACTSTDITVSALTCADVDVTVPLNIGAVKITKCAPSSLTQNVASKDVILYIKGGPIDGRHYQKFFKLKHRDFARAKDTKERMKCHRSLIYSTGQKGGVFLDPLKNWNDMHLADVEQRVWDFLLQKCHVDFNPNTDVTDGLDETLPGQQRFLRWRDESGAVYADETTSEDDRMAMAATLVEFVYNAGGQFVCPVRGDSDQYYIMDDARATQYAMRVLGEYQSM